MQWKQYVVAIIFSITLVPSLTYSQSHDLKLWYDKPAKEWVEALPVGNGRLGAMVFGGIQKERIQFNEDTLWTGVPRDYINPKAKETLPKVRELLFEGKQREAERVANDMMSVPLRQEMYQPFGDVGLNFSDHENVSNYRRELDLKTAIATTTYTVGDITYKRELFSSYPDQAIIMRITTNKQNTINCNIFKSTLHENSVIHPEVYDDKARIVLRGQVADYYDRAEKMNKPSTIKFESQLEIEIVDGKFQTENDGISVQQASEVLLKLIAHTSYKNFRDIGNDPFELISNTGFQLAGISYEKLKERHIKDHQSLFNRLSVDFGKGQTDIPTNQRIKGFDSSRDPQLVELYMQYGRYLLIASSRPNSQPANLQGIWNESLTPPWESKWTVNINTEMNYWIAEMGNLSECHEPLFSMLEDLQVTGAKVADQHYGADGWVLHHNTDVWRGAAPINASNHGIWVTGGAWLCQHLWLRYAFTQDEDFLRERAYPILKEAAMFFEDFLIEDPRTGWLISTPSNSPEIGGLVAGPSMDHQIIRNLLQNCVESSEILGIDRDHRRTWKSLIKRIAPNQIGQHGQLQEWLEDKDDPTNEHRHVSHLWALHPGNEISPLTTPELTEACKVTLSHRGDGGTGWSKAWKINFWARLHDGNHSFKMFSELITKSTLPNMFDTHPPFQIDGNFGGSSGIMEMLMQSHMGQLHILPALPDALSSGSITGLMARGGFEVDLSWDDGELLTIEVLSKAGKKLNLLYGNKTKSIRTKVNETYVFDKNLRIIN